MGGRTIAEAGPFFLSPLCLNAGFSDFSFLHLRKQHAQKIKGLVLQGNGRTQVEAKLF